MRVYVQHESSGKCQINATMRDKCPTQSQTQCVNTGMQVRAVKDKAIGVTAEHSGQGGDERQKETYRLRVGSRSIVGRSAMDTFTDMTPKICVLQHLSAYIPVHP
jgi:hypothetical protein